MRESLYYKRQTNPANVVFGRHLHAASYLAIILSGSYEEAGDHGWYRVRAGDLLLHDPFEAHLDRFGPTGALVLDLGLPSGTSPYRGSPSVTMTVPDPDHIARIAERDPLEAASLALSLMRPAQRTIDDWPQLLALALQSNPHLRLDAWAREHRLATATLSRGFHKVFGISPSAYRAQQHARLALRLATESRHSLCAIAQYSGFADQAHMTRAVRSLSGHTPGAWRRRASLA